MKFVFSILALFPIYLQANDIIVLSYHPKQSDLKNLLYKVLKENMDLPERFIRIRESKEPCERHKVRAAHLCIQKNGDIEFPIIYTKTMKETLGVYWQEAVNELEK